MQDHTPEMILIFKDIKIGVQIACSESCLLWYGSGVLGLQL